MALQKPNSDSINMVKKLTLSLKEFRKRKQEFGKKMTLLDYVRVASFNLTSYAMGIYKFNSISEMKEYLYSNDIKLVII